MDYIDRKFEIQLKFFFIILNTAWKVRKASDARAKMAAPIQSGEPIPNKFRVHGEYIGTFKRFAFEFEFRVS